MAATPKKTTRRKSGARSTRKPRSAGSGHGDGRLNFVTISLAIVAIALAALLAGFLVRERSLADQPSSIAVPQPSPGAAEPPPPAQPSVEPVEAQSSRPASRAVPVPSRKGPSTPVASTPIPSTPVPSPAASQPASYKPPAKDILHPPKPKVLIFIIDDAGYGMKQLQAFLELPFPLTIAVLPRLPNSETAAKAVRAAGKELMLHQPMQAIGGQNPGPGAILLGMGAEDIRTIIEDNLRTVPGAVGMNNHMGSAATSDLGIMETVAAVAKRRGIYYVDSLTTSGTTVAVAARQEGIPYWERNVFLDNAPDRASIIRAVEDGKRRATKDRPAIMIGHVWSAELAQTLTDLYPQLVAEGFSLSTISRFMVQEAEEDDASPGN